MLKPNENYTDKELHSLGLRIGKNVYIHRSVVFFNPQDIYIGSNVRIDCFAMLSCGSEGIAIGDNVHVAAGCYLFGGGGKIVLNSYCGLSSRVSVYTATDDYSEGFLTNPTIPSSYKRVKTGNVIFQKHAIIGSGSVVMPGVTIKEGAAVGALTFVNKTIPEFMIVSGNPLQKIGTRNSLKLKELEVVYENSKRNS